MTIEDERGTGIITVSYTHLYFSTAQRDAVEAMLTRYEQEQAELNLKAKAKN